MYYIWIYRCFGYINFSCFIWYSKFICICHRQNLTIIIEILTVGFVGLSFSIIMVSKWNYFTTYAACVWNWSLQMFTPGITWACLFVQILETNHGKFRLWWLRRLGCEPRCIAPARLSANWSELGRCVTSRFMLLLLKGGDRRAAVGGLVWAPNSPCW